jgi:cyclic pyranopterin phosphate synthase
MLQDALRRPVKDLRISVTDRCNFRCSYCMPFDHYEWIERREILSFEEIVRLARLFVLLGVEKIKLTGGEPLLRRDLHEMVARIARLSGLKDLCLTTNGSLLAERAPALAAAGLKRVNVSIDSLNPETYRVLTGADDLARVLDGLFAAKKCGLQPIKLNAVVVRGVNDQEILDLVQFSRTYGFAIRFIEYMDAGNANDWKSEKLVPKQEILQTVHARFPLREIGREHESAPAVGYQFVDGCGDIGVIASITEPFCSTCTRARLTADGKFVTCLFSERGHDLKTRLRQGATDEEILAFIRPIWNGRADRYSEERHTALNSEQGYQARNRTKIEMIRLGG